MELIYFAGKFRKSKKYSALEQILKNDYRAKILKNKTHMAYYIPDLKINDRYIYSGPFYCEQNEKGKTSTTNCDIVLNSEFNQVKNCDIFVCVFDTNFSIGSVVELGWALNTNKKIFILYRKTPSTHEIPSEYWFAIADAKRRNEHVSTFEYNSKKEMLQTIKQKILGE